MIKKLIIWLVTFFSFFMSANAVIDAWPCSGSKVNYVKSLSSSISTEVYWNITDMRKVFNTYRNHNSPDCHRNTLNVSYGDVLFLYIYILVRLILVLISLLLPIYIFIKSINYLKNTKNIYIRILLEIIIIFIPFSYLFLFASTDFYDILFKDIFIRTYNPNILFFELKYTFLK